MSFANLFGEENNVYLFFSTAILIIFITVFKLFKNYDFRCPFRHPQTQSSPAGCDVTSGHADKEAGNAGAEVKPGTLPSFPSQFMGVQV